TPHEANASPAFSLPLHTFCRRTPKQRLVVVMTGVTELLRSASISSTPEVNPLHAVVRPTPSARRAYEPVGFDGRNRSARNALVAARGDLSGLSAFVSGQQRRWNRRSRGRYTPATLPEGAWRRRDLAFAHLPLADAGFRLRHLRIHRHRSGLWYPGRF